MKSLNTAEAVGHILCHDLTQIIPGVIKDARFRKGHVVTAEDIPVPLSMGKEKLYVWEAGPGLLQEDETARRLLALARNENMRPTEPKEGKIDLIIAARYGNTAVRMGDKLTGMRVIPLVIAEEKLEAAEKSAGTCPQLLRF